MTDQRRPQISILDLLVATTLVAYSMWLLGGPQFEPLGNFEKVFVACFATSLVMMWGLHLDSSGEIIDAIILKGDPIHSVEMERIGNAFIKILYGIPGCLAGSYIGLIIFRPSVNGFVFGLPVLFGLYLFTHAGFVAPPSTEFCKKNLEGTDGDGI